MFITDRPVVTYIYIFCAKVTDLKHCSIVQTTIHFIWMKNGTDPKNQLISQHFFFQFFSPSGKKQRVSESYFLAPNTAPLQLCDINIFMPSFSSQILEMATAWGAITEDPETQVTEVSWLHNQGSDQSQRLLESQSQNQFFYLAMWTIWVRL